MSTDIRKVRDMNGLIAYFAETLNWRIDLDDFEDIEDIAYDFEAEDIGLKEEAFAKIKSLRQLPPLVDGQKWGIFCVEFDSRKFEVTALRKILSGLIPKRRNSVDHAVWSQQDLLFICFWGSENDRTIGIAHFEDMESGLPQIKMISCAPAMEDFTQIRTFEDRLKSLKWPMNYVDHKKWQADWSSAFTTGYKQTIRDASTLTVQLAVEAQGIRNRILEILEVESSNGYVHLLYGKFKDTLIHDMSETQFADMYAQTVVYGLFSARCMDETQDDFSAAEAVACIPNTNPFLKNLMRECLGSENNSKLSFDELEIGNVVDLLMHTKTDAIIADFNRQTGGGREDPVIHFYEEFLTAYDKMQKVQRGVYYTPQPVVNFIVRAVDTIIKKDFGLEDGLASTETKKIKITRRSKRRVDGYYYTQVEDTEEVPAIQVLDPATGTGTFIRQTILQIYENFKFKHRGLSDADMKQAWNTYVPEHLLPRINAFELMMAPYAVTHMKLAMVLRDTGYEFKSDKRLNVYLTNTLEEAGNSDGQLTLWSDPLATESIAANAVKKNSGLNIVVGNPPYSSSSSNRGEWITNLVSSYKKDLNERKINLDDDYIKFIRYGQQIVESGSQGILAYISNNSFIDGITHRTMRKELMTVFSEIYIINLHGNAKKKEVAPDGSKDENVFDIQQGVSINIFVRNKKRTSCRVFYRDLYGLRDNKYHELSTGSLETIGFTEIHPSEPNFFFVPKDFSGKSDYESGIDITEIFGTYNSGVQSKRDKLVISFSPSRVKEIIHDFNTMTSEQLRSKYDLPADGRDWTVSGAMEDIRNNSPRIIPYAYRPFDTRYTAYTGRSRGFMGYPRDSVMAHFLGRNVGLITCRLQTTFPFQHALVTNLVSDLNSISMQTGEQSFVFPLYLLSEHFGTEVRQPNINREKAQIIASSIGRTYDEKPSESTIGPEEIFAYIYAVLYTPQYRSKYKEFLKIGFPKIPIPFHADVFDKQVQVGMELIRLHLMEPECELDKKAYTVSLKDSKVGKYHLDNEKLYLNNESYIAGVAETIWNMYIGGYQPIQKWLKERKGIELSSEDINHLLSIIEILRKTREQMDILNSIYED